MKTPEFLSPKTALLRVWHWLNFLAISGLLLTAGLRKTFLSWRTNSAIIQDKLSEAGTTISSELARDIAVAIRAPMWDLHYVFGFILAALFLMRVIMQFIPGQPKIGAELKDVIRSASLHKKVVKIGYLAFYLFVAYMVVSGLLMYFKTELGLAKSVEGQLKELHELLMWFFFGFSALHVVGVFVAELRGEAGIVSSMISGGTTPQD